MGLNPNPVIFRLDYIFCDSVEAIFVLIVYKMSLDEQYTTVIIYSTAGGFDKEVLVNCLQNILAVEEFVSS